MLLVMPSRARPGRAVGRGISKSQARDCSGTARRAVLECDDSSQARDASGRLEESTRSATTRANEPGPGFLRHEPGLGFLRGAVCEATPPRSNPRLWLVATYLRTSRRCPLCKHAGGGGMCGGAWLVISTRSSFWG